MGPDPPFDFAEIARTLNARGLRFVLIGRQAVVVLGAPVMSFDYDLWVDPAERASVLRYFEGELGYELSAGADQPRPIVQVYAGHERIDLFLVRSMVNSEGAELVFEDVWSRAEVHEDGDLVLRIPAIDDLIALKKMAPTPRPKDLEDIAYLEVLRALRARGEA